ncbi:hypothetical protein [Limimaricola litoreus]|uniref:Uncharacterized protein n=1 Tax=Limimaricola litoreus TaxID=2955316 RepID=A0A9X2FNI0_9RHOB|nr:hypothetical protein [Limimaricola litoreus]MCP1168349.1 hypothetical protein [Limimaricola litoreus]
MTGNNYNFEAGHEHVHKPVLTGASAAKEWRSWNSPVEDHPLSHGMERVGEGPIETPEDVAGMKLR